VNHQGTKPRRREDLKPFASSCLRAFVVVSFLLLSACERRVHTVRYEVSGTAERIAISYQNDTGATEQRDVRGVWQLTLQVETGEYVGVSAFNPTLEGTVSCRVLVDGIVMQRATSEGGFKTASCGGLAGLTNATPTPRR